MAAQKLGSGCTLEKWTWPVKWTLSASQTVQRDLMGECLHTSRLGEHSAIQMTGQGYKELVHRQLFQDVAGMKPPPQRWKSPQG